MPEWESLFVYSNSTVFHAQPVKKQARLGTKQAREYTFSLKTAVFLSIKGLCVNTTVKFPTLQSAEKGLDHG